ncbi:MAG: hypothetical protein V7K98_05070 [Nostoc sp.]|uniref:hypothetical protein n=1 Tax=Nostoc sp. TaxID=1180 RepID=UPI002FFBB1BC
MNPLSPSSLVIHRLIHRSLIKYGSISIGSAFLLLSTNTNQASTNNSWLDKFTAINWIVQAKHGGFHQAMSTTGCAYATDIYKDHSLGVSIKIGGIQVPRGTQFLMTDAVDFL